MSKNNNKNILNKAEKKYLSGDNYNLLELLLPYKEKYPIDDMSDNKIFNHLLAFAYAIQNKLTDAEKHCNRCVALESNPLDHYFVLTFVHLSLREFDKVLKSSEQYIAMYEELGTAEQNYSYSEVHRCQMYNFIGSAHMELGNRKKAINHFTQSIEIDKTNQLPYLNLANLYINNKELDQAKKVVQDGIKSCSQIQELRILEKSLTERPKISACMIVKDEEELLPECLESIRNWVDEIIVVDTGSSDKTVEIAKSFGAKIFHQEWEGNFSKHRNYSLSLATSEWVFIIDADERMIEDDVPVLLQTLQNDNVSIVSINVFNVYGEREQTTTFLPSVRLWRRELDLKYEGVVHNLLSLGMEHPVVRVNVRLKHLGYDLSQEKMHQKFLRTKKLLEQQLDENQDNAFALYNYAQILKADRSHGEDYPIHNNELIIKSALHAVELTSPDKKKERHIHLMCLDQVAWGYFHSKEYEKSYEYAKRAISHKDCYLDPLLLIGHIFAQQKIWDKAKVGYKTYLEKQAAYSPENETDPLILSHIDDRASVNYSLGLIAETENDLQLAKLYYLKSLDADISFIETNSRLARIYFHENDLENAKKYYHQQLELSIKTGETFLALALIYQKESNLEKAENYFKEAISLEEFNIGAKLHYSKFLYKTQREQEATQILQAVSNQNNDSKTSQNIADIYFSEGFYNEASDCYKLIKAPSAEILNNIGNCYFKLEKYSEAESNYERALQFENRPDITLRNIGVTRFKLNQIEKAISDLNLYLEQHSQDYQIIAILAECYKKANDYGNALQKYELLLQVEPNHVGLLYSLSECYLLMGHKDSAIVGYKRILEINPEYQPAREQLLQLQKPVLSN